MSSDSLAEADATQAADASADHVVRFEDVHKHYIMGSEEVRALDGVSIGFERGSFWAVMGPSGSGKSTMLNLTGCLDRPSSGEFYLEEEPVSAMTDDDLSELRLRRLGFVFQSFHLLPQLTVLENIQLPLNYLGWTEEDSTARAEELAVLVGLHDRLGHRPVQLSGGQQQRVAIARSLANDPSVLLADEPTGNLDSKTGAQIMEMFQDLNAEGRTILMVTHTPEIAACCPNHLYMRDGKIDRIENGHAMPVSIS